MFLTGEQVEVRREIAMVDGAPGAVSPTWFPGYVFVRSEGDMALVRKSSHSEPEWAPLDQVRRFLSPDVASLE